MQNIEAQNNYKIGVDSAYHAMLYTQQDAQQQTQIERSEIAMSKDLDRDEVLEYLKNNPDIVGGAQKQLSIRLFPHESERLATLKGNRSYREFLNELMDMYESKKAGE